VISDASNNPLALESGEMKIIGETGKNIIIKSKDNNLFANERKKKMIILF